MRLLLLTAIAGTMIVGGTIGRAADLSVGVNLSGQVAPGVYGEVQLGNRSPPPLVYAQPVQIVRVRHAPSPIYLNVPPIHARNWRAHCHEYNACNRPVYFVRSAEYEPGYRRHDRRHDHDNQRYDDHGHGQDHDHDGDRAYDGHRDH